MQLSQLAVQLYTLRDHCKTAADLAATAKKVRAIGYQAVQVSGVGPIPEAEIVAILRGEGLTLCATHESGQNILDNTQMVIDRLHALGTQLTAYPYPNGIDLSDGEQVNTLIRKLDIAGAKLREAGLTLGYHNHSLEFYRPGGGSSVLDRIYAETSPHNLVSELDTYWVQCGGGSPVEWVRRMSGRIPFIHLKDYRVDAHGTGSYAEIGAGQLPFAQIIAEAEAGGCKWFIVEQDTCPADPFDSLRQSFDYIKTHLIR